MALRIIEMIIGSLFVSVAAIRLFYALRIRTRYLDIAIFGFLWIYVTTLYTLVLGILGILEAHRIAVISGIGLILLAIPGLRNAKQAAGRLTTRFRSLFPSTGKRFSIIATLLCSLAFLQLARILFHIWFVPPYTWDTVVYHLVNVAEWVQKGKIHRVITPVGRVYWPANFEVLEAWFVVFLHNDIFVKVAPFLSYLVAGASAYAIARVLNLSSILAASATTFYLFTPSLAIQATACKNDVGIAAVYLLIIAILLDLMKNRSYWRRKLMIIAMAFCLGIGLKPYMAFIAPAPVLIGLAVVLRHGLLRKIRDIFQFKPGLSTPRIVLCIFLVLSSALLGSYWYMRNLVVFGNPFHPTDVRIGSHLVFGTGNAVQYGPGQRGSASLKGLWGNFRSLVTDKILDQHSQFNSGLTNMTGWGWFSFVCGLSALAYALIFSRQFRLLIASFILSLLALFAFISTDPWYMRFTLWFPVIFALSFAFFLSNLNCKWLRTILMALALLCTMLNWIAVLNVGEIRVDDFRRMMQLPALKRSTAELTHHYEGAYRKTLQLVPEDEIIGFCFPNNGWAYPLYDSDLSRRLKYIPIESMRFTHSMKEQNVHYLFIERITPEETELINRAVQDGALKKMEEFLYALKEG